MLDSILAGAIFVALVLTPCVVARFSRHDTTNLTRNRDLRRHDIAI